jgi:predicted DNA-binding antitoxin AbrB/MazE fold protein
MGWGVVKGVYKQGVVEPLEHFPGREGTEVFVLFPEPATKARGRSIWQEIKQQMAQEMPDLEHRTMTEKRHEFDRLSRLIAEHLQYDSPEDLEQAMRGDEYDLARCRI